MSYGRGMCAVADGHWSENRITNGSAQEKKMLKMLSKHVEIWHEVPAIADSHFFFFLRNNDITKKKKAKQNSQNKQK